MSVRWSVSRSIRHTRVETMQKCRFWPKLLSGRARTHLVDTSGLVSFFFDLAFLLLSFYGRYSFCFPPPFFWPVPDVFASSAFFHCDCHDISKTAILSQSIGPSACQSLCLTDSPSVAQSDWLTDIRTDSRSVRNQSVFQSLCCWCWRFILCFSMTLQTSANQGFRSGRF